MAKSNIGKSFVVIDGDLRLLIERDKKMYVVSSLDIRGLNTQGKTIEEAIENAHDAAKLLAECRASEMKEVKAAIRRVATRNKSRAALKLKTTKRSDKTRDK